MGTTASCSQLTAFDESRAIVRALTLLVVVGGWFATASFPQLQVVLPMHCDPSVHSRVHLAVGRSAAPPGERSGTCGCVRNLYNDVKPRTELARYMSLYSWRQAGNWPAVKTPDPSALDETHGPAGHYHTTYARCESGGISLTYFTPHTFSFSQEKFTRTGHSTSRSHGLGRS